MIQTMTLADGVTLRCFYDNRFKQGALSFQLVRPMAGGEASLNALIPAILLRGTKKHPDLRSITMHLDDLYGAAVGTMVRRVGDWQTTGLACGMMDDRFALPGDKVLEPMIDFLRELLLEPCLEDGVFRADFVESEKKNLIATIESDLNDKRVYAMNRMLRNMCRADALGIPRLGYIEDVEAITAESLYAHYKKILTTSPVHVFYVGSADPDQVAQTLKPMLAPLAKAPLELPAQAGFTPCGFTETEEILDVAQGKLCLGYATPMNLRHPGYPAIQVCNTILGAGMTSKLFMQVREKMSLCYDIGSGFHGSKGIMLVAAGIEFDKKDIVLQEITRQLQEICNGNVSAEEMTAAKEALLSNLRATHDSPGAIEGYYASAAVSGIGMIPEVFMEKIQAVTLADVQEAAKSLELCTVYFLKGEGE